MAAVDQAGNKEVDGSSPARPTQVKRSLRGLPSQCGLIDAAEHVDRFPRIMNPPINGFDVEVGLVTGGISARLIVDDGHEHGRGPEFGERTAGPFSCPATVVNLVDEEHNLVGHLGYVRQLAYFEITGPHRVLSVIF